MSEDEIDIIEEFLQLKEIHSNNSLSKSFLTIYQEAVQKLFMIYDKQNKEINRLQKENQKLKLILYEIRNKLKFKVITKDNDYWGPRKNLTKQEVYKTVREIIDLLKANYCLDDEIVIQELLGEEK